MTAENTGSAIVTAKNLLPAVLDDQALLASLKAGGILKVEASTIMAAVRVALAANFGFFMIPEKLIVAMDEHADSLDEPVSEDYYKVRKVVKLNSSEYSGIFSMIPGFDGNFASIERKNDLIKRLNKLMWPAIKKSFKQLSDWREVWKANATDPGITMLALLERDKGDDGVKELLFPVPETGAVHDAVETLNNALNKAFSGTAVQITAALACDAVRVKELLEIDELPALAGYANREEMLRGIGLKITAEHARLEQNLAQFVLGLLELPEKTAEEEMRYIAALYNVGSQIEWSLIG